jgi:hypothetical protein
MFYCCSIQFIQVPGYINGLFPGIPVNKYGFNVKEISNGGNLC